MAKRKEMVVLIALTVLVLGVLFWHFLNPGGGDSFELNGVEWRVPDRGCYAYDEAANKIPAGFELPSEDDLKALSTYVGSLAAANLRSNLPFLTAPNTTFWTSARLSIANERVRVVNLADGKVASQVRDLCAHVLVRKAAR